MKLAAAGVHGASAIDPVCGMLVDEQKARAANRVSLQGGKTFYFCNDGCKRQFDANPAEYLAQAGSPAMTMTPPRSKAAADLVCGMKVDEAEAKAAKLTSEHQGKLYFFCNEMCKEQFAANPARYLQKTAPEQPQATMMSPAHAMQPPATGAPAEATTVDPVCAMVVDVAKATAANRSATYLLDTFYFCSDVCKTNFEAHPVKYVENSLHGYYLDPPASMPAVAPETKARDPVCGMTVAIEAASAARRVSEYQGRNYYFCSDGCKKEFDSTPRRYLKETAKK